MATSMKDLDEFHEVTTVVDAYWRDGEHMAKLTARCLDAWYKAWGRKKPLPLPLEFLLELSAVIRIATWQRAGFTDQMDAGFPPWEELLEQLLARLFTNPTSFSWDSGACPAPLWNRVAGLWFQHCSWTAMSTLGSDVVVHPADEEKLLDALADVLWKHRNLGNKKKASYARA